MIRASANSFYDIVEYLIKVGANVNAKNSYQSTALFWAAMKEDLRIVKLLLENGANPNFANYRMITPLAFAASKGNHEICKILLDHEADASIKTNDGETPSIGLEERILRKS